MNYFPEAKPLQTTAKFRTKINEIQVFMKKVVQEAIKRDKGCLCEAGYCATQQAAEVVIYDLVLIKLMN